MLPCRCTTLSTGQTGLAAEVLRPVKLSEAVPALPGASAPRTARLVSSTLSSSSKAGSVLVSPGVRGITRNISGIIQASSEKAVVLTESAPESASIDIGIDALGEHTFCSGAPSAQSLDLESAAGQLRGALDTFSEALREARARGAAPPPLSATGQCDHLTEEATVQRKTLRELQECYDEILMQRQSAPPGGGLPPAESSQTHTSMEQCGIAVPGANGTLSVSPAAGLMLADVSAGLSGCVASGGGLAVGGGTGGSPLEGAGWPQLAREIG